MHGKELETIEEGIRRYVNRKNGIGELLWGLQISHDAFRSDTFSVRASKVPVYNGEGEVWKVQNDDGSLPEMKGYDLPCDVR